jgi:hypothetical protein
MGHHRKKEKDYTMTISKKKTTRVRKDPLTLAEWQEVERFGSYANDKILAKLTPAERREIERETYEPSLSQRLRDVLGGDPSSGGKYFMNQMDRLRTLAGALAPLMQDLYAQADDLRWTLKEVEPLLHRSRRRDREDEEPPLEDRRRDSGE